MRRRYPYRIEVWTSIKNPDGVGGYDEIPVLHGTFWAKHYEKSGGESKEFQKVADKSTVIFEIRNNDTITESMHIVFRGKKYNIRYLPFDGVVREFLRIEAEAGVTI